LADGPLCGLVIHGLAARLAKRLGRGSDSQITGVDFSHGYVGGLKGYIEIILPIYQAYPQASQFFRHIFPSKILRKKRTQIAFPISLRL